VTRLVSEYRLPCFTFDFSGHGSSTGKLESSSLSKRVKEAQAALHASGLHEPINICAFSMSGHVALELIATIKTRALVLFYPAVYPSEAFDIPFGRPEFTNTIRQAGAWKSSKAFDQLRSFDGTLLVIVGQMDEVIPSGLADKIISSAEMARRKRLIVIDGAPHLLLPMLLSDDEMFEDICRSMAEYAAGEA